jgi:RNA polymerase sigma factor (sigma-70 family)
MILMATAATSQAPAAAARSVAELLVGVSDRDPAAWDEIMHRYGRLVSAKVRSFHLQDADALDAVQMTWLRLAENAHRIQFPDHLGGWLATTASRECLHILRHHTMQTPTLTNVAAENVVDPAAGPEQRLIDAETARMLWNLVAELSPRQRILLRALFTDNLRSYAQVAHATSIPPGGIGPTRARALKQLRRRLDEHAQ